MRKGTTPTCTFTTDIDLSDAVRVQVVFSQYGRKLIEKEKSDCEITSEKLIVVLTQRDTLILDDRYPVKIQIRAKFAGDIAVLSNTMVTTVEKLLKGKEI